MAEERSRLGRGLAALIGDVGAETPAHERGERQRGQKRVPIEFVHANPRNPRRTFVESELEELSASIRERGVIQPIVVRAARGKTGEAYEIIAGERRWRAAQRAGLHDVPVVIIEVSDAEALELAIVENVQRSDLNPIEEAQGYLALIEEFKHSVEDVARIVGKSRPHVANTIRLARLPEAVKTLVRGGSLSAGHARALVGHADAETIAQDVVARGLSVRDLEARMREPAAPSSGVAASKPAVVKDADTRALEKRLSDVLGLKVAIDHRGEGGSVTIRYSTLDQLDEVVRRLS
ncbi:MAG: ParB/RepB/Spo0J family partition protein [Rhizobiales bacterium]|nr:ParB/RepB/Spo0J family partition protein [Hyphomicrobiales bacterium]OJY41065.1 MAG: chromosome partitioning protein ParB [Rhizobiales bacterium 64-17]